MFRRVFIYSSPVAVALCASAGLAVTKRKSVPFDENAVEIKAGKKNADSNSVALHPFGSEEVQRWDHNWDKRDPFSLIDVEAFRVADEEKQKEMLAKVTPTATRNIFLIRHGQYELDSKKKELTSLGREQADILGKRLAEFEIGKGHKFNKCVVSTLQRADETAQIALKHLPHVAEIRKNTDLLVEGAPCEPEPPSRSWRPQYYSYTDGARIEAAFRKFIHRAKPKQKEDSFELFFFHANVIRYFVCRALQFPPEGWLRLSLVNSSITWIRIQPDGRLSLLALGDFGHLSPEKTTFT